MRWLPVLVLALCLIPMPVLAQTVPQDDAGSGGDAPATLSGAVSIEAGRVYQGNLTPGDRADWYTFPVAVGDSVEARVAGAYGCFDLLDENAEVRAHGCTVDHQGGTGDIPLGRASTTAESTGQWYFRYINAPPDHYRFAIGVGTGAADPVGASDAIAALRDTIDPIVDPIADELLRTIQELLDALRDVVQDTAAAQDDAGTGSDAPASADPSFAISPGHVLMGNLTGSEFADVQDWYAFSASAGDSLEAKLASSLGCIEIFDAVGEELDRACMGPNGGVAIAQATAASSGVYFVNIASTQPKSYQFSVGVDGPAPLPIPGGV